ncbi:MAG: isoprenyl transferase [bacterium]|nr:isoprenyl transferase [bacterium]
MARQPIQRPDLGGPFPEHIAIIMDGNGRWAQERGMLRVQGHTAGVQSVREITTQCARMGVKSLTLYAFSVENWKRPSQEVKYLMRLLRIFLHRERKTLMDNGVRLGCIGRRDSLPAAAQNALRKTEELTAANDGMLLRLALSYGSRSEIADAARAMCAAAKAGELDVATIDEDTIRSYLYDPETPDPDLIIRTAGEMRISNFLLWQMSYSELYVTDVCWPDFRKDDLALALRAYARRKRKFGSLLDGKDAGDNSRNTA